MSSDTLALFRDLQSRVRADLGDNVDDDTLLYEVARRALGGPVEDGRASYQVAVTRCDACGQASIDAAGESHPVDDVVSAMAACDARGPAAEDVGDRPHVRARDATRRVVEAKDAATVLRAALRASERASERAPPTLRAAGDLAH